MAEETKSKIAGKAEVLEAFPGNTAIQGILAWNADALTDAQFDFGELTITIAADQIRGACAAVQAAGYEAFQDMTAVDWYPSIPRFQLSYHILSYAKREMVRLRVWVEEASSSVESITEVWPGANYYEREVFDLFGIRFEGHPNLRRIMMPDDFKGHPLRKDYPVEGYR